MTYLAVLPAALLFAFVALPAKPALAHGGGLNSEGCHNNRRTGDYHCHGGAQEERRDVYRDEAPRRSYSAKSTFRAFAPCPST